VPPRVRAMCPDGSLERHRVLCHLLLTGPFQNVSRVLFVAPEPVALDFVVTAFPHADVVAGYKRLKGSFVPRTKRNMHEIDLTSIAFPDNFFDLVIVQHVLEHVENDVKAMQEVGRITRAGGSAVIEVPIYNMETTIERLDGVTTPEDRLKAYGQRDHVRRYGHDFYDRLATSSGLEVDAFGYSDHFSRHASLLSTFHNPELHIMDSLGAGRTTAIMCIATKSL
jgi:SAM-dependent methyltransferase